MAQTGLFKIQIFIETAIDAIGRLLSWLTILMVINMTLIVVLRYGFNIGWVAMQESVVYMHACVFMFGVAYTLGKDEHVRVDIFYQRFSAKQKALVDFVGTLLILFPVSGFLLYYCLGYVVASWDLLETSSEAGGIPAVFLLKSLMVIMPVLLILQGVATAIAQWITLTEPTLAKPQAEN